MSLSSGRTHTSTGPAAASVTALRSPSSSSNDQDNPFAPPPEDAPEQPWRPRPPPHEDVSVFDWAAMLIRRTEPDASDCTLHDERTNFVRAATVVLG